MIDDTLCMSIAFNKFLKRMMIMSNEKNNAKNVDAKIADVAMTVADVARELKIDPKRARAFLRKNVELYVARKQRFTKSSTLYTKTKNALIEYAKTRVVVTK